MRDWPPCLPVQRDGGRQSRPGVNPFISALTVARCPATFPGVWPQLRDILSTSRSVGRGMGAFIYALSADETRDVLAAPRHTITALFFAASNALVLPGGNLIFAATPTERITHYTLQARLCAKGRRKPPLWKPPVLSVRGHRSHFCTYVLTPSKTQRNGAGQPTIKG